MRTLQTLLTLFTGLCLPVLGQKVLSASTSKLTPPLSLRSCLVCVPDKIKVSQSGCPAPAQGTEASKMQAASIASRSQTMPALASFMA